MEKKGSFNKILEFMVEMVKSVLIQIATNEYREQLHQIVQHFFVKDVKNNKVDPITPSIYTILKNAKYKISY